MSNLLDNNADLESVSFAGLFGAKFAVSDHKKQGVSKIVIPRIQRDYAQGRDTNSVKRVRERFLSAIKEKLCEEKSLRLDFIYGDIDESGVFTPFDGQQRLTTIFLLHWYALQKLPEKSSEQRDLLLGFTYETRPSARRFCEGLANGTFDVDVGADKCISDQIRNHAKFVMSWNSDPTVRGMLCMLDAIGAEFASIEGLWDKLVSKNLIQFYVRPMKDMGLTDKLYIKMNARGKPLTNFEHFKAEFEQVVEKCDEAMRKEIALKFDTKWADAFFAYRDKKQDIVDDALLHYFKFVCQLICWQEEIPFEQFGGDEFKLVHLYSGQKKRVEFFRDMMDCWVRQNGKQVDSQFAPKIQDSFFSGNEHVDGKVSLFREDVDLINSLMHSDGIRERLLLFAVTIYLRTGTINEQPFKCRLRALRNLLYNSQDEIRPEKMKSIFDEVEQLILNGTLPLGKNGLNANQKKDEARKRSAIEKCPEVRSSIECIEDLPQFRGGLAVIDEKNFDKCKQFSALFSPGVDWCQIQRAMLTFCDCSQLSGRNRCFGSSQLKHVQEMFKPSTQRTNFGGTAYALNRLIAKIDDNDVNGSLETVIANYLANPGKMDWRYYFVKYLESVSCWDYNGKYLWWHRRRGYSFQPTYFEESPYEITALHREQLNGKNWNWFLLVLWDKLDKLGTVSASLNDFAYSGDLLEVEGKAKVVVDALNDHFVLKTSKGPIEIKVAQSDEGIDIEDRVEVMIKEILAVVG